MNKKDIYLKLEITDSYPELTPGGIMITAWYKDGPMVDEELFEALPELKEILAPFTSEEIEEGTVILENSEGMTLDFLGDMLQEEGFEILISEDVDIEDLEDDDEE